MGENSKALTDFIEYYVLMRALRLKCNIIIYPFLAFSPYSVRKRGLG
jgi:hypothetical protein